MYPVSPNLGTPEYFRFVRQPFIPSGTNHVFWQIGFGKINKEVVVSCFAFHEATVEVPEVFIFQSFTQTLKALTTSCFDEGKNQQFVKEPRLFIAALQLKLHERIYIDIFSLPSQCKVPFP